MEKTIGHVRASVAFALKRFPKHKNQIGKKYEELLKVYMGHRTTWVSNREQLDARTLSMFLKFQEFVDQMIRGVPPDPVHVFISFLPEERLNLTTRRRIVG